ncbi:MAG: NADH dehydrogenase [Desulfuromonadales bacterium GWD2_61_12]|nr:MAG: NADH dehydrogenase [Desulfuromonadales bacterium GWD2_61_12]HAD04934.1 NADH-quinone oxidoreductase subunit J [Desulfuromonas sp.]HBT84180.1 NADH-quinone oxidoreductase subunit J [Desulfuromonas sp.]
METLFFYFVALVAVGSGILVVTCRNPVHSALALVNTFFCLATFYVMLEAPFMAAIQIMVYAGAIMVLIIFVIMLLNLGTVTATKVRHSVSGALLLGALMLFQSIYFLNRSTPTGVEGDAAELVKKVGHTEAIGRELFTNFLLPFEITSILLLVAIVGAVVLAKREV